jgi:hypothetical protein
MAFRSLRLALTVLAVVPMVLSARAADVAPQARVANLSPANSALDVPIKQIAATSGGCAVLDKDFPGLRTHTMYPLFKDMTLRQIAAMSHGKITPDMLAQARADLSALPIKVAARQEHGNGDAFASPADEDSASLPK